MKHTITLLLLVLILTGQASAAPELSLSPVIAWPGGSTSVSLSISGGTQAYAGVNAKILLPKGVSVTKILPGTLLSSDFITGFRGFSDTQGNGVIVIAYSRTKTFATAGTLFNIGLTVSDAATAGTYNINFASVNPTPVNSRYALSGSDGISVEPTVKSASLIISEDSDKDGLPDVWEQQIMNADPNDAIKSISDVVPGGDFDGDGFDNLTEFKQGSSLTDPDDHPSAIVQKIELSQGYQIISLYIQPENSDVSKIMTDVLDNLEFMKDSKGNMLRKIGASWINNIGDWKESAGYLVKMRNADTLSVQGSNITEIQPVSLTTGYQFVGYLCYNASDISAAFETLKPDLGFVKDSNGNMLRKIASEWIDNIGTLQAGQGYLLKMNAGRDWVYSCLSSGTGGGNRRDSKHSERDARSSHFSELTGNADDPTWTIYLSGAKLNGANLEPDDEIVISDGDRRVGVFKLSQTLTDSNKMNNYLTAWKTLEDGPGYAAGNPYTLRCWDASAGAEFAEFKVIRDTSYSDAYTGDVFPEGEVPYSVVRLEFSGEAIKPPCPCDPDNDHEITLADAVIALKVVCGLNAGTFTFTDNMDVDGDKKIGLAELICILKDISDMK